jgi:hypothetical protein
VEVEDWVVGPEMWEQIIHDLASKTIKQKKEKPGTHNPNRPRGEENRKKKKVSWLP